MRAMILTQQKRVDESPLARREVDAPRTGPGEVRVKVSVCAVCRTDIHIVEGDLALHKMPVIPGHQIVGRVDETGAGVPSVRGRAADGHRMAAACGRPLPILPARAREPVPGLALHRL